MSRDFNNVDFFRLNQSVLPASGPYQILAYVDPRSTGNNDSIMGCTAGAHRVSLLIRNTGEVSFDLLHSGIASAEARVGTYVTNQWQAVAASTNGVNGHKAYYNGTPGVENTNTCSPPGMDAGVFDFGESPGGSNLDAPASEFLVVSGVRWPDAAFVDHAAGVHPLQLIIDYGGVITGYSPFDTTSIIPEIGSYTLTATPTPATLPAFDASHPTIDPAPSTDTTPPVFSIAAAVASITSTGGTATATINESGDIYYVVVADGATAPTSTEVIAGTGSGGSGELASGSALAGTVLSDAFSGLSASTPYDIYFTARDDEGSPNVQVTPTKVDFSTTAAADTTAPTFSVAPAVSSVTNVGALATATINEAGDIFYVVVADGATAPSVDEVIAGTGAGGTGRLASGNDLAGTVLSDAFAGLGSNVPYDVYFAAQDDEGSPNKQAAVTKVDFTTNIAPVGMTGVLSTTTYAGIPSNSYLYDDSISAGYIELAGLIAGDYIVLDDVTAPDGASVSSDGAGVVTVGPISTDNTFSAYILDSSDGTNGSAATVTVTYVASPAITDIDTDEDIYPGQINVALTGTAFEANKGTGGVRLNSQSDGLGIDVSQTDTFWSITGINITVSQGGLSLGTVYAFVKTDSGFENAVGFPLTLSASPDVAAPLLSSSTIDAAGTSLTIIVNENVNIGAGGNGGFSLSTGETLAYVSGDASSSLVYSISPAVLVDAVPSLDYIQPTNGWEDDSGNDLATFTSAAITNDSTATPPDVTAPILSSPTGVKTGSFTANGTVITNEGNGTLDYLVSINASETAATIIAGSTNQTVSGTGIQNTSMSGLAPNMTYYLHYVHTDNATNESNVVSSLSFTTDEAPASNGTFGAIGQSSEVTHPIGGWLGISISGTFAATIVLERSHDNGASWQPVSGESYTAVNESNFRSPSAHFLHRLNCTAYTSGTVIYFIG